MNTACRFFITLVSIMTLCHQAYAERHLEVGGYLTTTTVPDDSFAFFSSDTTVLPQFGPDIRFEVADIRDTVHLLPYLAYRYGAANGDPIINSGIMHTGLILHDISAGLRGRIWILSWLGGYAQVFTGVSFINMEGEIDQNGQTGMHNRYVDDAVKWHVGGGLGLELRVSPRQLEKTSLRRLNFGGEIGMGFVKRMQTNFNPTLEGGDDLSLSNVKTTNFGDIDLSGVLFQMGLTVSFR